MSELLSCNCKASQALREIIDYVEENWAQENDKEFADALAGVMLIYHEYQDVLRGYEVEVSNE